MKLKLDRINETKNATLGNFFINDVRQCYTLENDSDPIKVIGETRIPAGTYPVELRNIGVFYKLYSEKFGEDHPMLWLRNVPSYQFVLIHIGNYHENTAGCILVGEDSYVGVDNDYCLIDSTIAYKKIYYPIRKALEKGEEVTIEIGDTVSYKEPEIPIPEKKREATELPKLPIWKKNGFKRIFSFITGIAGLALTLFPETAVIGKIITYAAGTGFIAGVGDSLKKNREKDGSTYVDKNKVLRFFADLIIKLIKQYVKKKGK